MTTAINDAPVSRLFVSYSHKDRDYTERLCRKLSDHGFQVWSDGDLTIGDDFVEKIRETVRLATAIIVVMSPESANSRFVRIEILEGLTTDRPFVPILLTGEPLFLLNSLHYFDARAGALPGAREIRQIRDLCATASSQAPSHPAPPPPQVPPVRTELAPPDGPPPGPIPSGPVRSWPEELAALLRAGQFGAADQVTTAVMLDAAGRLSAGWLRTQDAALLPAALLLQLETFWRSASAGKFGFQRQLALRDGPPAGAPQGGSQDFFTLADTLGWRLEPRETIPRYGRFITADRYPHGYPDGFFPTLRSAQIETNMGWMNQWRQCVMAVHLRLRTER